MTEDLGAQARGAILLDTTAHNSLIKLPAVFESAVVSMPLTRGGTARTDLSVHLLLGRDVPPT